MDLRALRQRCETRLRDLPMPRPFDLASFCAAIARSRGREIHLQPTSVQSGPYGLWAAGPSKDVIFYDQETSPLHQLHIILHELCHLICEHTPLPRSDPYLVQLLCPHMDAALIQQVLGRASYSTEEECEAELLASLILRQVAGGPPGPQPRPLDIETAGVLRRLEASLERVGSA